MTDPWLRLAETEFFLLWDAADLGEPPDVLNLRHIGRTRAERDRFADDASTDLLERDLGTVAKPIDDLADALLAIGHRELTLSLAVEWAQGRYRAVAGRGPEGAAIAVAANDTVSLRVLRPAALVNAIIDEVPTIPAGPGVTANVLWPDYLHACREGELDGMDGFLWVLREAGLRVPEARTIARAVVDRHAAGQVDVGPRTGQPIDSINWVDTLDGRYVLRRRDNWLSVIPADLPKLSQLISESLPR
ncbi:MAG TPA: ESX secretion-associated protein EspG [Pseudonocardiaceae bacterium]|nr:ESX secretion-associated protein EspG [Pseudonocardiaceae bacterium]